MRRRTVGLVAAIIVLSIIAGPAGAQDPNAELTQVQDELDRLESQIDNSRTESRQVGEQLSAAQESLAAVQAELAEAQGRVDSVTAQISGEEIHLASVTAELEAIQASLLDTTVELQNTLADLEIQAVELYMNATASVTTLMIGFNSAAEATVGLAYVEEVTGESEDLVDTFEFLKVEEERQQQMAADRQTEVEGILAGLEVQKADLEGDVAEVEALRLEAEADLADVRGLLSNINAQIAAYEEHYDSLEADAARLEEEIARLQERGGTNPGVLAWPINGPGLFAVRVPHPSDLRDEEAPYRDRHRCRQRHADRSGRVRQGDRGVAVRGLRQCSRHRSWGRVDHAVCPSVTHRRVGGPARPAGRHDRIRGLYGLLHRCAPPLRDR